MDAHVRTYKKRKEYPEVAKIVDIFKQMGATKPVFAIEKEGNKTIGKEITGGVTWR